jgi:hypothetical protein
MAWQEGDLRDELAVSLRLYGLSHHEGFTP